MMTVGGARSAYRDRYRVALAAQVGAFSIQLGPLRFTLPNPGYLDLHDVHHMALDAPPTVLGEVQVSAFELRTRIPSFYVGMYIVGAVLVGLLCWPLRTVGWLRCYGGCRSFYDEGPRLDAWLARPVSELYDHLRLEAPRGGAKTRHGGELELHPICATNVGAPRQR